MTPHESLNAFQLESPDLRINLVASEPEVVDPVALCFDEKGRLYVVESRGYPHPGKGMPKTKLGRIARLEDVDGDGLFEKRVEFAQGLVFPNGILPWKQGFFVTDAPDLLYLEDSDDDGVADKKELVLTGFGTGSSSEQLRVAYPTFGPDSWIYLTSGLTGGNISSPKHPDRPSVKAGKNDWRFHPETLMVESLPSAGQFGQAFDRDGRRFICDNRKPLRWVVFDSGDQDKNTNASNVMDLAESGLATPLFPLSPDTTAASYIPKLMRKPHAGSFTSSCGLCFYSGDQLPLHRGSFFICEPAQNLVHCRIIKESDEILSSEPSSKGCEFLASPDQWFRPVFAANGPDGALYICDMYRKYIDHPNYLPPEVSSSMDFDAGKRKGRIWKVSSTSGKKPKAWHKSTGVASSIKKVLQGVSLKEAASLGGKSGSNPWFQSALFGSFPGKSKELIHQFPNDSSPSLLEHASGMLSKENSSDKLVSIIQNFWVRKIRWSFTQRASFLLGLPDKFRQPYQRELQSQAIKVALDRTLPDRDRLIAIRIVIINDRKKLLALLNMEESFAIRESVIRTLVSTNDSRMAKTLLSMQPILPAEDATVIIDSLLAHRPFQDLVMDALESSVLPLHAISLTQRRSLAGNPDLKIRAEKLFQALENSDRMKVYHSHRKALDLPPDLAIGRDVFHRACASCHKLGDMGYEVGPDLTGLKNQSADTLLLHILVPNREVYPAYAQYQAETKEGEIFVGILRDENTESVHLLLPMGHTKKLDRSSLKALRNLPVSLMPDGLEQTMTDKELVSLIAFMRK